MNATLTTSITQDDTAQAERDAVAKALRRHAELKRADHGEVMKARAEAIEMALGYTELSAMEEPVLVDPGPYSAVDVLGWIARAVDMGAAIPRLGGDTIERIFHAELVPNAPFRAEVERRGLTMDDLRKMLVMPQHHASRDIARQLGIEATPGTRGYPDTLRLFITYDQAITFMEALELAPHDCGV